MNLSGARLTELGALFRLCYHHRSEHSTHFHRVVVHTSRDALFELLVERGDPVSLVVQGARESRSERNSKKCRVLGRQSCWVTMAFKGGPNGIWSGRYLAMFSYQPVKVSCLREGCHQISQAFGMGRQDHPFSFGRVKKPFALESGQHLIRMIL